MSRRLLLVPVAGMVLLAGAACSPTNGGQTPPDEYARTICAGLLTWRQGVANDSARLSRQLQAGAADISTVKGQYSAFFQGVVRRTDALLTAVDGAGAPSVDDGTPYARDLRAALATTRAGLLNAQRRFAALPTNNVRSYAAGAEKIRDDLGAVFLDVGSALDRLGQAYPDKDLNEAFEEEPDCKSLA